MFTTVLLIQERDISTQPQWNDFTAENNTARWCMCLDEQCGMATSAQSTLISKKGLSFQALYLNKKI